jgi:phosphatidylglycerol:prolipoprotein diacylglycerol transferase
MRTIAEIFRQPDIQLGFLYGTDWLTMGMQISLSFAVVGVFLYSFFYKKSIKEKRKN